MAKARLDWVDAAKGISIFLVVLTHATLWLEFAGLEPNGFLERFNQTVGSIRMPLFFAMSGLFAAKWMHTPWRDLMRGKVAILLWTFLLWQVAMFAYKTSAGQILPDQENAGVVAQLVRALAAPVRPNAELWFLWALIVFFVAAKLVRDWRPDVAVGVALFVSVLWSGVVQDALGDNVLRLLGPGLAKFPVYFVFFLAAAVFSGPIRGAVARVRLWVAALVVAAWIFAFGVTDVLAPLGNLPGLTTLRQLAGIAAGIAAGVLLQRFAVVAYLGANTLPVYLSHTTFIVAVACGLHLAGVDVSAASAWLPWALALVSIAFGLLLGRIFGGTWLFDSPRWFTNLISLERRTPFEARR